MLGGLTGLVAGSLLVPSDAVEAAFGGTFGAGVGAVVGGFVAPIIPHIWPFYLLLITIPGFSAGLWVARDKYRKLGPTAFPGLKSA